MLDLVILTKYPDVPPFRFPIESISIDASQEPLECIVKDRLFAHTYNKVTVSFKTDTETIRLLLAIGIIGGCGNEPIHGYPRCSYLDHAIFCIQGPVDYMTFVESYFDIVSKNHLISESELFTAEITPATSQSTLFFVSA